MIKKYLLALLISLTFNSCNYDNKVMLCNEPSSNVWSIKLEVANKYYGCILTGIDANKLEVKEVIQTQEQFKALTTCGSLPDQEINFDSYTILAGRLKVTGGGRVLNQWVSRKCDAYTLHVQIGWGTGNELGDVFYFAVIDKILDQKISYDVQVLQCETDNEAADTIAYSTFWPTYLCGSTYPKLNNLIRDYGFVMINSQSDYEKYFFCTDTNGQTIQPPIDFNKQTILAGKVAGSSTSHIANQFLLKRCNQYFYMAEIIPGATADLSFVNYYAVVPKIPDDATVFFDFRFVH